MRDHNGSYMGGTAVISFEGLKLSAVNGVQRRQQGGPAVISFEGLKRDKQFGQIAKC